MARTASISHLLLLLLVILSARLSSSEEDVDEEEVDNCPSVEALRDDVDVPAATQLDSETVLVEWGELWQFMDWKACIEQVSVVVSQDISQQHEMMGEGKEHSPQVPSPSSLAVFAVSDVSAKNARISVAPCIEVTFEVEVTLKNKGEKVRSLGSDRDFKTFRSPQAKAKPPEEESDTSSSSYYSAVLSHHTEDDLIGMIDLTAVDVKVAFHDIVEDPGCHKVVGAELRFRSTTKTKKEDDDDNDDEDKEWTTAKVLPVFRNLEETVRGLTEICSPYEIGLRLLGTPGTDPVLVRLGTVPPADPEQLRSAHDSGFRHSNFTPPRDLILLEATKDGLTFAWDGSSSVCATGYKVTARRKGDSDNDDGVSLTVKTATTTLSGLSSCSAYDVTVHAVMAIVEGEEERRFESRPTSVLRAVTRPSGDDSDDSEGMRLASFRHRSGVSSVVLSWSTNEIPCYPKMQAELCPLPSARPTNDTTCFNSTSSAEAAAGGKRRTAVTFKGLQPCSGYKAVLRPLLAKDNDQGEEAGPKSTTIFQSILSTKVLKRPPRNLSVKAEESTETSLTLTWLTDACAVSYIVTYSSHINANVIEGTRHIQASTLELTPVAVAAVADAVVAKEEEEDEDDSGEDEEEEGLDIGSGGNMGKRRRKRTTRRSAQEGADETDYDYEADFEESLKSPTKEETTTTSNSLGGLTDDEDYEDSDLGSGSGQGPSEEDEYLDDEDEKEDLLGAPRFRVSAVIADLTPCTEYEFRVQNYYSLSGGTKEHFGEKSLVRAATACAAEPFAEFEVKEEKEQKEKDSRIRISWKQRSGQTARLRVFSSVLNVSVSEEVVDTSSSSSSSEDELVSKTFDVQSCHEYLITITDAKEEREVWNAAIITASNKLRSVELSSLGLEISSSSSSSRRGLAKVSWIHDLSCVSQYRIRLTTQSSSSSAAGEMTLPAPRVGGVIGLDLHMLPGMLKLKNCETYELLVVPKGEDEDDDEEEEDHLSIWQKGFSKTFRYVTDEGRVPNTVSGDDVVLDVKEDQTVEIRWEEEEALSCDATRLSVKSVRSIQHHSSSIDNNKKKFLEVSLPPTTKSYVVGDLLPCIGYELQVFDEGRIPSELIFAKEFKTSRREGGVAGDEVERLNEEEVMEWKEERSVEVQLEWMDRCSEAYSVKTCRMPCNEQELEKVTTTKTTTVILDDVSPCSVYRYSIADEKGFRLRESNFSTIFLDDFMFSPEPLRTDEEKLTFAWDDYNHCVGSYDVTLGRNNMEDKKTSHKAVIARGKSGTTVLDLKKSFPHVPLVQCSDYDLSIKPILAEEEVKGTKTWSDRNEFVHSFFHFTDPEPPRDVRVSVVTSSTVEISWDHLPCHTGYRIVLSDSSGSADDEDEVSTVVVERVNSTSVGHLLPCTQYSVSIRSVAVGRVSSSSSMDHTFMTSHSDEVVIAAEFDFESASFEVRLHGTDCVARYLLFLCEDHEAETTTRSCWNQTVADSKEHVVFDRLFDGRDYSYQLVGYNDHGGEVFLTPEHQARTRKRISGSLIVGEVTASAFELRLDSPILSSSAAAVADEFWAEIVCHSDNDDVPFTRNMTAESVTFDELSPNCHFKCSGTLHAFGERAKMNPVSLRTSDGIPEAPLFLTGKMEGPRAVRLSWEEPIVTNGELREYQITAKPDCRESNILLCPTTVHCAESRTTFSGVTSAVVAVEPHTRYSFAVAARTNNPSYGPFGNSLSFETPSTRPDRPEIVKVEVTKRSTVLVNFTLTCPTTGPTTFSLGVRCGANGGCKEEDEKQKLKQNGPGSVRRLSPLSFEVSDLPGGHFYDVWVKAEVEGCSKEEDEEGEGGCASSSEAKVAFVPCDYKCRDGTCLNNNRGGGPSSSNSVRCNFVRDCPDGSDEDGCRCDPPGKFRCDNGYCIKARKRCDGNADCNDFSDEARCPRCHDSQFMCEGTKECISKNMTCDRRVNCRDGSDEHGCAYWTSTCWPEQFRCLDHTCVDIRHRCDGIWDCVAGEDELSCNRHCPEGERFACKNRQCIPRDKFCDGRVDCADGSDELYECTCHKTGQFACKYENQCVARLRVCDGKSDCKDGSDEAMCPRKSDHHKLEADLPASKNNLEVISKDKSEKAATQNDATAVVRPPTSSKRKTTKAKTTKKISEPQQQHFPDFDYGDIRPVPTEGPLYDTDLRPANQMGNKKEEKTKKKGSSLYRVRTYPESQWVYDGDDVIIQCRDEGDLRASDVLWRRKDRRPMPRSAVLSDRGGRLTLPSVAKRDEGIYVCYIKMGKEEEGASREANVGVRYRRRRSRTP